jgi:hypothetical protein
MGAPTLRVETAGPSATRPVKCVVLELPARDGYPKDGFCRNLVPQPDGTP